MWLHRCHRSRFHAFTMIAFAYPTDTTNTIQPNKNLMGKQTRGSEKTFQRKAITGARNKLCVIFYNGIQIGKPPAED